MLLQGFLFVKFVFGQNVFTKVFLQKKQWNMGQKQTELMGLIANIKIWSAV